MLHLPSHIDQRLVFANFVTLCLNCRADVKDIDQVLRGIFFRERLLFSDQTPNAVTLKEVGELDCTGGDADERSLAVGKFRVRLRREMS
jgi:hypothetical protein